MYIVYNHITYVGIYCDHFMPFLNEMLEMNYLFHPFKFYLHLKLCLRK